MVAGFYISSEIKHRDSNAEIVAAWLHCRHLSLNSWATQRTAIVIPLVEIYGSELPARQALVSCLRMLKMST